MIDATHLDPLQPAVVVLTLAAFRLLEHIFLERTKANALKEALAPLYKELSIMRKHHHKTVNRLLIKSGAEPIHDEEENGLDG